MLTFDGSMPTSRTVRLPNRFLPSGFAVLLALAAAASPAAAQEQPLKGATFSEEVSVGVVLVPVVVRSQEGYVNGLDPGDFVLEVDGRAVRVDTFERRRDAPVSLVFLQDLSGSMAAGGKLEASQEAVGYILDNAQPADEFAIATFASGSTLVEVPFTADLAALRESLGTWEAYGTTTLHDAVAWLPDISAGGSHAKRAAMLLTDGADNASKIPPTEARDIVRRAQVPVYVVGLGSGSPYQLNGEGGKLNRFADVLNLLASYTGGRYFPVAGADELKEAAVSILEELRHQYVLGFAPAGTGPSSHHRIRVTVPGRKYRVLARQGYTGRPPAAAN
jgi:Ca-activated chloride channel homolog